MGTSPKICVLVGLLKIMRKTIKKSDHQFSPSHFKNQRKIQLKMRANAIQVWNALSENGDQVCVESRKK